MTVGQLIDSGMFEVINKGETAEREISKPFCCDLLSIAMGRAPTDSAWVTVMGNMNTLAVASLAEVACIILAEGICLDDAAMKKAKEQEITVLAADEPVFETAQKIWEMLHG